MHAMLAYFVHDLADPAVARRVLMLQRGGARLSLAGFRRSAGAVADMGGLTPHDLGRTRDGKLAARALATLRCCATALFWSRRYAGHDVFIARNLEMLLLAALVRAVAAPRARLIYELLDVHRLLATQSRAARLLRGLEGALLRRSQGVIISAPDFETEYLRKHHTRLPPVLLIENRVVPTAPILAAAPALPAGPPWRIGWFGVLRCRRSLHCLAAIARQFPDAVQIDLRGKIAVSIEDEAAGVIAATPGMRYHGPYTAGELRDNYGQVHFAWAVDFYEQGLNSTWLLPNRLYESGAFGAVPIALSGVATGAWLLRRGLGFVLDGDPETAVPALIATLTPAMYEAATAAMRAAPKGLFYADAPACVALTEAITNPPA